MTQKQETKEERKDVVNSKAQSDDNEQTTQSIRWDDSAMTSTYANVCNVSSTREEVTLLFGTNQTWVAGQRELAVLLSNRIIINPYAAKRLSVLLNNVMREYESRFGELNIEVPR